MSNILFMLVPSTNLDIKPLYTMATIVHVSLIPSGTNEDNDTIVYNRLPLYKLVFNFQN